MMPPIHFLMAWIISSLFTKNITLRRLAAIGGTIPDLDGVFILFDMNAYYAYHHVIFHPLLGGVFLGVIFASAFWFYRKRKSYKPDFQKYILFFIIGVLVHDFGDIIGTNWSLPLLFPLAFELSIYPLVSSHDIYGVISPFFAATFILAALAQLFIERKTALSFLSEKLDGKIAEVIFKSRV